MSKNSGVNGKTVNQVIRYAAAVDRQAIRDSRTDAEQIAVLDERPGASARERARLAYHR